MNQSINHYKDLLIAALYFSGIGGYMFGEVIVSTAMILTASLLSSFHFREAAKN